VEKLFLITLIVVSTVAASISAIRMRRRIRRALGSNATEVELTSISAWMKVDQAEEQGKGGKLN
jgi:ribose/xylose/arabinose/galactoside ABC-type transport system permease subunit